jgi:hypothetical protein
MVFWCLRTGVVRYAATDWSGAQMLSVHFLRFGQLLEPLGASAWVRRNRTDTIFVHFQLNPRRRVVACLLHRPHFPVNPRRFQSRSQVRAQEQVVDA